MIARAVAIALVLSFAETNANALQSQAPAARTIALGVLEAQTLARHPAILEAAARVEEARGLARQAGAWTNPIVGVSADEIRPRESPSGFFGGFAQQAVPLGGKLAAARTEGEREVSRREGLLASARQRVISVLHTRFYGVLAAQERVTVIDRLAALSNEAVLITSQLVNVGAADRPDLLASQVDARRAALELVAARTAADTAWRLLAVAAADPSLQPGPLAPSLDRAFPALDRQSSLDRVLRESPELATASREIERERASVDVARRAVRPDLFLRGEAGWNREHLAGTLVTPTGWQFGFETGLNLPLVNRNLGGIQASTSAVRAAEARLANLRLALEARFSMQYGEYEQARAAATAYRADIIPRAQEAYELYLAKYQQMAAAYPQVLVTQRTLFELTEEYINTLDRAWRAALRIQGLLVDDGSSN